MLRWQKKSTFIFPGNVIVNFNGVDYYISNIAKNWQDAENDCINRGGHLTSVHSQAENDFLNQKLNAAGFVYARFQNCMFAR